MPDKPLWGYRLAVAGMLGITFLSWFVWQHHLFVSGINADLRPFYMLSTELISLPTGFIFLCAMGTLCAGRIRLTRADAVLLRLDVQLPVGWDFGQVQLRRPERATGTPGTPIPVGHNPYAIAITPDGKIAYVANFNGNTVTPIDLASGTPGTPIPVGVSPYAIAITG